MSNMESISKEEIKDDYALGPVPEAHKGMGLGSLVNTTIGVATALVFMQLGSIMALAFGSINAMLAIIYATIASSILGIGTSYLASKSGMNVNLMARGGGFGYIGASLTSIIYASNFIMYCAIEGAIMAAAVYEYFPIMPLQAYMIFFGLIIIPLNWFGIQQLDRIQKWSLPIYLILLAVGIYLATTMVPKYVGNPFTFLPEGKEVGGFALLACIAIMNGLVAHLALVITDYARFIKKDQIKVGSIALGSAIPVGGILFGGIIGIYFGVRFLEGNPGVYIVQILGIGGVLFTILTQLRINVNNLYSGSLSLANFFENVFKFRPGRNFWVATVAILAIVLMLLNVLDYLDVILTFQGVFVFAWVSIILTDAFIVKKVMKIGPDYYEHRQSKLYGWNPAGVIAVFAASFIGAIAVFGYFGVFMMNTAAFLSGIVAIVLYIIIVKITNGKYYQKA